MCHDISAIFGYFDTLLVLCSARKLTRTLSLSLCVCVRVPLCSPDYSIGSRTPIALEQREVLVALYNEGLSSTSSSNAEQLQDAALRTGLSVGAIKVRFQS